LNFRASPIPPFQERANPTNRQADEVLASYKSMKSDNSTNPETNPTELLPPITSWESAPKLPPDHWIYQQGPQITFLGGLERFAKPQHEKPKHDEP
jgi:hypothetical protein